MPNQYSQPPLSVRFWANVNKTETCWLWTGGLDAHGYGKISLKQQRLKAHRVSWEIHSGAPVPADMCVLHRCDTPACVNPGHLFLGTQRDNIEDMAAKGRGRGKFSNMTHCANGHEFTEANTRLRRGPRARRTCLACMRAYQLAYVKRRRLK